MTSDIITIGEMLFIDKTATNDAYVLVDYNAAGSPTNIPAGITDTVSFKIIDHANDSRIAGFIVYAINDRHEAQITNVLQGGGNSKNIEFFIPPARGAVSLVPRVFYTTPDGTRTNTFVVTVSNWGGGSNDITKTRIVLPAVFNSKVIGVSNTFLNYTQASPEVVTNSTNVIITYTNKLSPGEMDKIYLTVKVDYNTFPLQTVNWGIYVDNAGTTLNETILMPQGFTNQHATVQPYFTVYESDINDHSIFTTDYTNIVSVRYINGTNVGSYSNSRFKITVPQPFIMPSLGNISTGKPSTVSINGRDIIVTFTTLLDGGNYDIVTMNLSNQFEEAETNTVWSTQIDYGDGIWKDADSNALIDSYYYTNVLSMVLPPASALSYLEPATLFVDVTSQSYVVSLSNSGSAGNHIRLVEIIPPSFITSASNIISTISGSTNWFANGRIYVQYSSNERLLITSNDSVSFIGYDNATTTSGSPVSWVVKVANTTNTNDLVSSGVAAGKTLSTLVTFPEYRAEYHVTPVNIDSASTSNQFTIYIDNKSPQSGSQDSYIQKVKFDIPQSVFLTNGLVISSAKTEDITITGYTVILNYTNTLAPKSNDIITLGLSDYFESGNTNVFWNILVNFNTIGTNYTNGIVINGTNVASFGMPKPLVKAWFVEQEIYTTSTNARLVYVLSNFGQGSNDVEKVTIKVPDPFNSGCTNRISTRASSISYDGTNIILTYTNFSPTLIDTVSFDITNSITSISNLVFDTVVSNSTYSSNVYAPGAENTIKIVNAPSAKIDPTQTDTTKATNTIVVYLLNNGSGSSSLTRAKVVVPDIYTSIISATSSKVGLSSISNTGNTYFIDYSSAPVINGDFDSLTFTLVDGFTHGTTNQNWVCYIDNGNGYAQSVPENIGALTNSFVMPAVVGTGWLNTTWVYASENQSVYVTNTVSLSITNEGSGSNNIYTALVVIPQLLTNISSISSTKSAVIEVINSTNLYLYYTNDLLKAGEKDVVSFTLIQNLNNPVSYEYGFYIDNDGGNGLIKVGTPSSDPSAQQRLDILVKDEESEMYISGAKAVYIPTIVTNRTIYTMDDSAVISVALRNKSKQFSIESFTLNLTNLYTITAVANTISGSGLIYSVSNNTVTFTYTGTKLEKLQYDTISIFVSYDKNAVKTIVDSTGPVTNILSGMIKYEGSAEYIVTSGISKDELLIDNATFGRFYGQVQPKSIGATVTLKFLGTETLATNTDGSYFNSVVDSSSGVYVLDKIPVGQYDIVVLPPTLEQYQTNGKTIDPVQYNTELVRSNTSVVNTVNNITNIKMTYKSLDTQAQNEQQVLCPDDPLTRLIVPPDTLINGISVNIQIETMSSDQANDTENNTLVKSPASSSILPAYHFIVTDLSDNTILEEGFKGDVEIVLHYDISNIQAQGWSTNDLAIYYWKHTTRKWIMIGGLVDSSQETISIKAGYLHTYYAVMQKNIDDIKTIHNVKASPNPFTPGRGDGQYSNMKLTFMFDKPYDTYQVKIFNIKGQVIRSFTRDGTYAQGEVFWDGKDKNGFFIPGGVYLYQIKAGGKVYTGSVLLLR
ncbi:MAG: hypothetical protein KAS64_06775 [Spirochaetes bacterium]|nr:hypothetical protein [Spirochaetota bacterium]